MMSRLGDGGYGREQDAAAGHKLLTTALWCTGDAFRRARTARLLAWHFMQRKDWEAALEYVQTAQAVQQQPCVETALYRLQILLLKADESAAVAAAASVVSLPGFDFDMLQIVVNESRQHRLPAVAVAALSAYHELVGKCGAAYTDGQPAQLFRVLLGIRLQNMHQIAPNHGAEDGPLEALQTAGAHLRAVGPHAFFGDAMGRAAWFATTAYHAGHRNLRMGRSTVASEALQLCLQFHTLLDKLSSGSAHTDWDVYQVQAIRLVAAYTALTGGEGEWAERAGQLLSDFKSTANREGWLSRGGQEASGASKARYLMLGALSLRVLLVDRDGVGAMGTSSNGKAAALLSKVLDALHPFSAPPAQSDTLFVQWLHTPELVCVALGRAMAGCNRETLPRVAATVREALTRARGAARVTLLKQTVHWVQAGEWEHAYPEDDARWLATAIWTSYWPAFTAAGGSPVGSLSASEVSRAMDLCWSLMQRSNTEAPTKVVDGEFCRHAWMVHCLQRFYDPEYDLAWEGDGHRSALNNTNRTAVARHSTPLSAKATSPVP
jgi:hypothetical protein